MKFACELKISKNLPSVGMNRPNMNFPGVCQMTVIKSGVIVPFPGNTDEAIAWAATRYNASRPRALQAGLSRSGNAANRQNCRTSCKAPGT
ncbi:hypothetical protein DX980_03955 [Burkholderia gladioli]|nr:hypothetical protein C3Y08_14690 [Burkholderia gladioli]PRG91638.1 hypothetical protein C6V08_30655 [Burkholderia gladioli]PRH37987.1 hypothetical protein C6V07_01125 [Burkholderia gladioli]WAG18476.1 hypothetical protein DX980_03955 [Burkholderia gladioli]